MKQLTNNNHTRNMDDDLNDFTRDKTGLVSRIKPP